MSYILLFRIHVDLQLFTYKCWYVDISIIAVFQKQDSNICCLKLKTFKGFKTHYVHQERASVSATMCELGKKFKIYHRMQDLSF